MTAYTSLDALKYLALEISRTVGWATDSLCGSGVFEGDPPEIEAICQMVDDMNALLGPLAEAWNHYSDGREIKTTVEIEHGFSYDHTWHPDSSKDTARVVKGKLLADRGEDNGSYEIHITPPQSVTARTFPRQLRVVKE